MRPKNGCYFLFHLLVVCFDVLRPQELVIRTAADLHHLAQDLNGIVRCLFFDKLAAIRYCGFEKMPTAFFKMSRSISTSLSRFCKARCSAKLTCEEWLFSGVATPVCRLPSASLRQR